MGHTAWPTTSDVGTVVSAMGVTLGTNFGTAYQQSVIDAVVDNVHSRTRRDFIPVAQTRYFDGNGEGEMEIDDYTTIHSVSIVGFFGITPGISLAETFSVSVNRFPKNRIQVYQGSVPALYRNWVDRFPVGRGNIQISADWGYGLTIPEDLWNAVRYQAAGLLISQKMFNTSGFLVKWQEADVTEVNQFMDPFKFFKSSLTYEGAIKLYRRPSGYFIRKQRRDLM